MASKKGKDGRWRWRFTFNGKDYSGSAPKGANTMRAADALERKQLERVLSNRYTGEMPTVAELATRFLDHQGARVKPLTHEGQTTHLVVHVVPRIGKLKIDTVTTLELDAMVTAWKLDAEASTINTRIDTLRRLFATAVAWGMLSKPPAVAKLKVRKKAPRFLSEIEAVALFAAMPVKWRIMMFFALRTGLRVGELRGLQWTDVSFTPPVVHVQRTDPGRHDVEASTPKSGRGRVVPLTPDTIAQMRQWLELEKMRLGGRWSPSTWIWPGSESWRAERDRVRTRSQSNCKDAITRYAKKAGLTKKIGWHTLRHTYASWLVMRGVGLRYVQDLLGHSSIKQTEVYAHLAPNSINQALVACLDFPLVTAPALPSGER